MANVSHLHGGLPEHSACPPEYTDWSCFAARLRSYDELAAECKACLFPERVARERPMRHDEVPLGCCQSPAVARISLVARFKAALVEEGRRHQRASARAWARQHPTLRRGA